MKTHLNYRANVSALAHAVHRRMMENAAHGILEPITVCGVTAKISDECHQTVWRFLDQMQGVEFDAIDNAMRQFGLDV
jgi:hypothetical protein